MSLAALASAAMLASAAGCAPDVTPPRRAHWLVLRPVPTADPAAPPDDVRWAIERLLSSGLVDEDSSGTLTPALARTYDASADGRTWTFVLRQGLTFASGDTLRSADVREALERGLARRDHSTQRWLLRAVEGVESIRPGRTLPKLGIETPDDSTLILRLARPDSLLPSALALPGVATPWRVTAADSGWNALDGVGPYRVVAVGRTMTLARRDAGPLPVQAAFDTLWIRFATGARARTVLRQGGIDVAWPVPIGDPLRADALEGYHWRAMSPSRVRPARRLDVVMRADVLPTAKLAARRALAHSLNRTDIERIVADGVEPFRALWPDVPPFDFPRLDEGERLAWMRSGKLGASFHTQFAFDPDEIAERIPRRMQGQWARAGLSVDLRPLRGSRLSEEHLGGRAQLLLQITHGLTPDRATDLAMMTTPFRDAPVGRTRTGWRAPELRPWMAAAPGRTPPDPAAAQRIVEEGTVILPLGVLGWTWIEREGPGTVPFHPHFGPIFTLSESPEPAGR